MCTIVKIVIRQRVSRDSAGESIHSPRVRHTVIWDNLQISYEATSRRVAHLLASSDTGAHGCRLSTATLEIECQESTLVGDSMLLLKRHKSSQDLEMAQASDRLCLNSECQCGVGMENANDSAS